MTMNSSTITNYIRKLEKENRRLHLENRDLRDAIVYLHSYDEEDIESVASNDVESTDSTASGDSEPEVTSYRSGDSEPEEESEEEEDSEPEEASDEEEDSEPEEESEEEEDSEPEVESEEEEDSEPEEESDEEDGDYFSYSNHILSHLFFLLSEKETEQYKKRAYLNASKIIKELPYEPSNGTQLLYIRGIGKSIARLVDEYVATGTIKKLHA